ncbi:MAG: ATP-binding protein [Candidatus Rokubacteria bacterium]|nr:ATP-binding protein [Candidatus Rokubacteria bacterium]
MQRRFDDLIAKLETKYGDLRGRVEVVPHPVVTLDMIGGAQHAKSAIGGLSYALRMPELYRRWGISPPRGALLYGPPGNGKTLLAKALATASEALFYHMRLTTLTSKVGPNVAEVIKEVFQLAASEGRGVIFFDDADALSLEHILSPERAREAAAPLISGVCELLDGLSAFPTLIVLAATSRPDGIDSPLIAPGRLDHLIEVPLPEGPELREIIEIIRARAERVAERTLFESMDYEALVPRLAGMSGGEVSEVLRRALEGKVQLAGVGPEPGRVATADVLRAVDEFRRVRDVVVKIRYGQYL